MDDLISRQAAIDAFDGEISVTGRANAEAVRGYVNLVRDRIKRLPTADVQPVKHGHWEESPMNGIVCSECGRERPLEPFGETEWNSDFCPWCGTDMRGDEK